MTTDNDPTPSPEPVPPVPAVSLGDGPAVARDSAWRSFWANPFGKVAVVAASALVVLTLVGGVAAAVVVGARGFSGHGEFRAGQMHESFSDRGRPGPMGPDAMREGRMGPHGMGPHGMGPHGMGPDSMMGRMGQLPFGEALHGELTMGGDTPTTILYQVGEVTEVTAGKSLSVKSTDGFTATYVIDGETNGRVDALATGQTVRVVADKADSTVTFVMVVNQRARAS